MNRGKSVLLENLPVENTAEDGEETVGLPLPREACFTAPIEAGGQLPLTEECLVPSFVCRGLQHLLLIDGSPCLKGS